jgi:urease accessory protein
MASAKALLRLLQMCDSSLPIGAYSHSWAMETWTQQEHLQNAADVERAIGTLLRLSISPKEGAALRLAYEHACADNSGKFQSLNSLLSACNWAQELHTASLSLGERLKVLAQKLGWVKEMPAGPVHHCAVFGWLSAKLSIQLKDAVTAYLSTSVSSQTTACVKLVPLGHTDGQRIITNLAGVVESEAESICSSKNLRVASFAPMQEWASFEHERLYSRLFQS